MAILRRNKIQNLLPLFEKRTMRGGSFHFQNLKPNLRLECMTVISQAQKPFDNFCILPFGRNKISNSVFTFLKLVPKIIWTWRRNCELGKRRAGSGAAALKQSAKELNEDDF